MPSTEILLAFTAAALLLNISPGPSNFFIIARSIAQGTRGGIVAALGLAAGSSALTDVTSRQLSCSIFSG
jgi:threonine/homoserine/homoserine lactone efflux protein